ncbi:MAG: RNA methyltransferase [Opitutaceae bacterium]
MTGMAVEIITSLQNPRIKNLVRLRDRRPRDEQRVFPVEGYRAISRALEKKVPIRELYYAPEWFLGTNERELIQAAETAGARLFELTRPVFAKVAYRDRPEGLLAIVDQWQNALDDLELGRPPFLLVVESIEKPGNLGTILRSADAAGVDAVIVCDPVTDLFNPNVVRSSTGVLFAVDVAVASSEEVIAWLRSRGIRTAATTPHTDTLYTAADLTGPLAVVMGSEQFGLSRTWLEACDLPLRIPMAGQADSLNVAMATLITLFEAVRQRTAAPST